MTNHVHLIVTPYAGGSLAKGIGLTHQLYAQYVNDLYRRDGHLWHSRYYSCPMDDDHFLTGMGYVEKNPQRAGLVRFPWDYPWSSATAHCNGVDPGGLVSFALWQRFTTPAIWREILCGPDDPQLLKLIRDKTRHGRPLGGDQFIDELEEKVGRPLRPRRAGRPRKPDQSSATLEKSGGCP
jgi:putative transposase